jgi:hypothetical protein
MLPVAFVAHAAPGRTRFKIPARRRDGQYFATVEQRLPKAPDVEQVQTNPLTGSVLIHHRGSPEALHKYAEEQELFRVSTLGERASRLLAQRGKSLDRQLRELTGEYFDLRSITLIMLVSIGMVQVLRGQLVGSALTIFWYASTLLDGPDGNRSPE